MHLHLIKQRGQAAQGSHARSARLRRPPYTALKPAPHNSCFKNELHNQRCSQNFRRAAPVRSPSYSTPYPKEAPTTPAALETASRACRPALSSGHKEQRGQTQGAKQRHVLNFSAVASLLATAPFHCAPVLAGAAHTAQLLGPPQGLRMRHSRHAKLEEHQAARLPPRLSAPSSSCSLSAGERLQLAHRLAGGVHLLPSSLLLVLEGLQGREKKVLENER